MTRPSPEGFKHRLLLELAGQIPPPGAHAAVRPVPLPGGSVPVWRRHPVLAGVGAIAAGGALAGVLATGAATPPPAKTSFTTAAWTVTTRPDGSVVVMIRDVRDPAGLQARLRAAGVPAVVRVASPSCGELVSPTPAPYSDETYRALTQTYSQYLKGWLYVVHPDAIKPGHTLAILIQGARSGNPSITSGVLATSHPLCRPAPKPPVLPAPTATAPSYVPSQVPSTGPPAGPSAP